MNPFRIVLLVLLTLSLAMLFYVVAYFLPEQRADYEKYQSQSAKTAYTARYQEHMTSMDDLAPGTNKGSDNDFVRAQKEAELKLLEQERRLLEAEERSVIALEERRKREQAAADAAKAEAEAEESRRVAAEIAATAESYLGTVHSYDKEWAVLAIMPEGEFQLPNPLPRVVVRRNNGRVCEASVDSVDDTTGVIIASVISNTMNPEVKVEPELGDKVYILPSASAPRSSTTPPTGTQLPPIPTPPKQQEPLKEMDMPLVPTEV